MRNKTVGRRVRFHAAYLAILMMLCEALASVWPLFEGTLLRPRKGALEFLTD